MDKYFFILVNSIKYGQINIGVDENQKFTWKRKNVPIIEDGNNSMNKGLDPYLIIKSQKVLIKNIFW